MICDWGLPQLGIGACPKHVVVYGSFEAHMVFIFVVGGAGNRVQSRACVGGVSFFYFPRFP